MIKQSFSKTNLLILLLILLVGLIFRMYKINSPLADLHSWRQADTAAVTRNFVKDGIDFFHPRYDDLSGRESGIENPQGYRMVEFPLYNGIVAVVAKSLPLASLEFYGRLINIFFSLITIAVIYFLLLNEVGLLAAVG